MKKIILILFTFLFFSNNLFAQIISIAAARAQPLGNIVTISGVVTNGGELGTIRYMQDGTAGIAVYDSQLNAVNRGDDITVTGTLSDYFNLLELNPVSALTINSAGNPLPTPLVLTPLQLSDSYEGQLVQINNVIFTNGGGVFAGNANYSFTANGESGTVRIIGNSPLAGQPIPTAAVTLTAICSQYQSSYQLLPRDPNDITITAVFYITSQPSASNLSASGFDVNWTTNLSGSTYIEYGHTPVLELGILTGAGGSSSHTVSITGANPAELFYVKAYSVNGNDTAYSGVKVFMTASNSSGIIKAYFNRSVNNSVADPASNLAIRLNNAIADTLKAYIDRAQFTLDIAIYNFDNNNTFSISQAINDAYSRGVTIRIIADGNNTNTGLTTINAAIPVFNSPLSTGYYGIMHSKFMTIDANAADPNLAIVWTGSTNWTDSQLNTDANNIIIVQDQSLAKTYTLEFDEMWGSTGNIPVPANSKFGPDKTDNTPHEFMISGKRVENYFSPSDNVNNQILNSINTADNELYFATMVFTRFDLATVIADRVSNYGVYTAGIVNDSANGGQTSFYIIQNVIGSRMMEYDHASLPGILHHKYMIVDQGNLVSDPLVLTGSHNWSSTANLKNDENTVIVHDPLIANQYYQEFYQRFDDNGGGSLGKDENNLPLVNYIVYPNPSTGIINISIDSKYGLETSLEIYTLQGKMVLKRNLKSIAGSQVFILHAENFADGLYFLKLNAGGFSNHRKLIISK